MLALALATNTTILRQLKTNTLSAFAIHFSKYFFQIIFFHCFLFELLLIYMPAVVVVVVVGLFCMFFAFHLHLTSKNVRNENCRKQIWLTKLTNKQNRAENWMKNKTQKRNYDFCCTVLVVVVAIVKMRSCLLLVFGHLLLPPPPPTLLLPECCRKGKLKTRNNICSFAWIFDEVLDYGKTVFLKPDFT